VLFYVLLLIVLFCVLLLIVLFYVLLLIVLFYVLLLIVLFYVLFVCKRVLYYCHRVSTQSQLTNISYHKRSRSRNWKTRYEMTKTDSIEKKTFSETKNHLHL